MHYFQEIAIHTEMKQMVDIFMTSNERWKILDRAQELRSIIKEFLQNKKVEFIEEFADTIVFIIFFYY